MIPTEPVEGDVGQPLGLGEALALGALAEVLHLGPLGVAEGGVVVEGHLGVEHAHLAVGREHERVDLDEVGVTVDVALVELHDDLGGARTSFGVEPGPLHQVAGRLGAEPVERVDVQPRDRLGVFLGHLLDLDPATRRDHRQMQLGGAVEGEAGVVLLGDVGRFLDPEPAHQVSFDVEAQDVAGMLCQLGLGGGQLDAARLAAASGLDLGLYDDGVAEPLGGGFGLGHGVGHLSGRYRHAVTREVLLALVLN